MKLIALIGKKGHGKDTFAKLLRAQHPKTVTKAFADPVKDGLVAALQVPREHFDDPVLKNLPLLGYGVTPRDLMEWEGTKYREKLGNAHYVRIMARQYNALVGHLGISHPDLFVITDCRFEGEAYWIHAAGGLLVEVVDPRKDSGVDEYDLAVISTMAKIKISNDSDLAQLHIKALGLLGHLGLA